MTPSNILITDGNDFHGNLAPVPIELQQMDRSRLEQTLLQLAVDGYFEQTADSQIFISMVQQLAERARLLRAES